MDIEVPKVPVPDPLLGVPSKLDPEVKKKWVENLRSGNYAQGAGSLCRDGNYCCLGVLAHQLDMLDTIGRFCPVPGAAPGSSHTLREGVNGKVFLLSGAMQDVLANMNDGSGMNGAPKSFEEIADFIEKSEDI